MRRAIVAIGLVIVAFGSVGCGDPPAPASPPPHAEGTPGHDTDKLRAASAIGYDGDGLQRSVDRMRADAAAHAAQSDAAAQPADR